MRMIVYRKGQKILDLRGLSHSHVRSWICRICPVRFDEFPDCAYLWV